jgi:plasmid stability protein
MPKKKATEQEETGQMIIRQVPEALRREFKALCAREGKSMQEKIIELMREAVKE